ncbi:hypothetical protein GAO09_27975 [Rhizobiales bacterium RZME27]|jgi:hypothetical protein|uniref:Transmembrane protein n=1 Tax=Endobacterium cereale TaxID=2663029 RepID=A0A6A8AJF2_9HYPH|nr:hypothetical protein [Endobacterium cereale]MEB2842872.1 hypothetical protein [Endobacterium cereale]MQY49870.1 hypothetical protein [Endobacterium cereale]
MNKPILSAAFAILLASCTATPDPSMRRFDAGPGLQPIPGSITYGGQPRTKLTKSPIGSSLTHEFENQFGYRVIERYVIQPDRSLLLVSRRVIRRPFGYDD